MHDGLDQVLGVLGADHDVAQLARSRDRVRLVDREGQHVGRRVASAIVAVELADAPLVDELDRQVTVCDPCGSQCRLGRVTEARIVCLDLDQDVRRSCGAWRSVYSLYAATIRCTSL